MHYSQIKMESIQASPFGNRLDAEFYLPKYLTAEKTINQKGFYSLREITTKIDVGHVGPMVNEYTHDGVWLLQTQNVREFFLSGTKMTYISSKFHNQIDKSKVRENDILIARSGSFGVASILLESREVNSADVIIIRCLESKINPCYLVTYLNCKYGVNQLIRFASGGLQGHVNLTILEHLKVCNVSKSVQKYIELVIHKSYTVLNESNLLFSQAQHLLLNELGLIDWNPKHSLSFVKKYSDTQHADRIDADHFQPKYVEIEESIRNHPGGWDTLGNLVNIQDSNFKPEEEIEYSYIELANIGINGEISECTISKGKDLPTRARRRVEMGDVIVSSIEGSLDSIALIGKQHDQVLCSTGFHILRSKVINPETLLVLMKSIIGQYQLRKGCAGTILSAISKNRLDCLYLPRVREEIQAQIRQEIVDSVNLRERSKHLLECAKRSVEIAIEQGDQTAIDWLEKNAGEG